MENIIARHPNSYLESHKYLAASQSGFMKGKSCTIALLNMVEDLMLKIDENRVSVLLNKLQKLFNFSNSVGNPIFSYLLDERRKVHLNGNISDPLKINFLCCSVGI